MEYIKLEEIEDKLDFFNTSNGGADDTLSRLENV